MNEFNAVRATNPKPDDDVKAKNTASPNSSTISINKKDEDINIMGYNLAKECRICGEGIIIQNVNDDPVICKECASRLKKLLYGENNG